MSTHTLKDFRFKVQASPLPQRRVRLSSDGKSPLEAATPPEFRGGTPDVWSPEDLLVAAVASCYALTLDALMEQRELVLRHLEVEGVGHVTKRAEGRVGFVVIELRVALTVDAGFERRAEHTARDAHRVCLVAHALDVPVELELAVGTAEQVRPTVTTRRGNALVT
ncbi:MAG: OsmC family protein [Actinobacteria bacterium]|nr:MAG: OsmC family protein [Actinomycetota bacterium]